MNSFSLEVNGERVEQKFENKNTRQFQRTENGELNLASALNEKVLSSF